MRCKHCGSEGIHEAFCAVAWQQMAEARMAGDRLEHFSSIDRVADAVRDGVKIDRAPSPWWKTKVSGQ